MAKKATSLLVGLAAVLAFGAGARAQTALRVPAGLLQVAGVEPELFTEYLAAAYVPAGLELKQRDLPELRPMAAVDRTLTIEASVLVRAFNGRHSGYRAELLDDVVVVRPLLQRASYLDRPALSIQLNVRGVMNAARKLFAPLDPRIDAPGGRVGSGLGGIDSEGEGIEIAFSTEGRSVLSALNEISKRALGHAWVVITTDAEATRISQFGFIRVDGSATLIPISAVR